ncbi:MULTISPECIES: MgtC/SapB family protein [unclassified Crossiella]|uniref:MgtC/SapB family protein n=1 Tax=unclassified Crossiella TaxID=2620835 RepID=UPI00207C5403|nr:MULTISPECIES: MgtC/SapB family protein [unclassified Crossiella]MCO1581858.1 MgtC/SapB family protein [Crossiella sp. SN42]WHT18551.1 MgtC/SapB family protein [Crossiella sp. CA-258035]
MTLLWWEVAARLGSALVLGSVIGLERQWRARMAGLRTNALVATGAALFVLLSVLTPGEGSPTRIAAQVVSGIGFLGAGVIIRDGVSLRGINTAATIWGAAGVGCLAGAGLFPHAAAGAAAIVLANVVLRSLARKVDRTQSETDRRYLYDFKAVCRDAEEAHIRALVVQSVTTAGFVLQGLESEDLGASGKVEVTARLSGKGKQGTELESAVSRLSLEPGISSVSWRVVESDPEV